MTNQTTYAAMREALEFYADESNYEAKTVSAGCKCHFETVESETDTDSGQKAREALALPEPDPAQELLASVQLEQDAARYQKMRTWGVAPMGTKQLENRTVLRFTNLDSFADELNVKTEPTPNKADADALVRILRCVKNIFGGLAKEEPLGTLCDLEDAYQAATPLIKQIAGGG